jgi:hypothetical protein
VTQAAVQWTAIGTGTAWALVPVFLSAAAHKVRVLRRGRASQQPVLQTVGLLKAHPQAATSAALAAECGLVVALVLAPLPGLALAALVLIVYTQLVRRLAPGAPCACFGGSGDLAASAVRRNAVLLTLSICAAMILAIAPAARDRGASLLVAAVVGCGFVAYAAGRRMQPSFVASSPIPNRIPRRNPGDQ